MDDLTLFNLISLEYFFFRYPYHNLIMTTLGKFGPNRAVMSGLVFFVFHNLIRKLAFNPQLPLMRQRKLWKWPNRWLHIVDLNCSSLVGLWFLKICFCVPSCPIGVQTEREFAVCWTLAVSLTVSLCFDRTCSIIPSCAFPQSRVKFSTLKILSGLLAYVG